jgi:hypothetical protein
MKTDNLATILEQMGVLRSSVAQELSQRCDACRNAPREHCRTDCPTDELVRRVLVAEGLVTQETLDRAVQLQRGMRSERPSEQLRAATALARESRKATRRVHAEVQENARYIARKSNPRGYAAVTVKGEA